MGEATISFQGPFRSGLIHPDGAPDPVGPLAPVPTVSFLLACYNRREVVLQTLDHVKRCGLPADDFEIFVVDNASTDGTPDAVAAAHRDVHLIRLQRNGGPCQKIAALPLVRGKYIVFLDDDSWAMPGSTARMIRHFQADPTLGAATFTVTLPDGSRECSAYPNVFIGCGVGLRKRAIDQVGGLPTDFFMAAEEYDLSLRLLAAGWDVRTFDDLHVTHLKTPGARSSTRLMRLDTRNNLILIARYFPERWAWAYARDWMRRYGMMARVKGQRIHHWRGLIEGTARVIADRHNQPLSGAAFERFARIDQTRRRFAESCRAHNLRRVLFVDLGKNVLAYWLAARKAGVHVVGIADRMLGGHNLSYRGIPIVTDDAARQMTFDAAVVSNLSPVHAELRRTMWRRSDDRPIIDLFEPGVRWFSDAAPAGSGSLPLAPRNAG